MHLLRMCTVVLHAPFGARVAGAFVASFAAVTTTGTTATTWRKGYTSEAAAVNLAATRRSRRQDGVASSSQTLLQKIDGYDDGDAPAKAGTSASAASPGIQAPTDSTTHSGSILASLMKMTAVVGENRGDADTVLYFAFGANMCPSIFTNKRGVQPRASLPVEAIRFATSSGQETKSSMSGCEDEKLCLCFCHRAGYATLRETPGPPQSWETSPGAHGVVHAISSSDLNTIAAYENGYRKQLVEVETPAGERGIAVCFVSTPAQTLPTSVPPTSRYLALLQNGAAHHGIDERYRSWLAQLPSVPPEEEATSPERINTPSKFVTDAIVAAMGIAALGAAVVALGAP